MSWPLDPPREQLVRELGLLIARGGAWRFMRGPVVAANTKDYPDKWEENRAGVARALARTLWHARIEVPCTLTDHRAPGLRPAGELRKTNVELVRSEAGRIELALDTIGNDAVAGVLATEVGRAYAAQLALAGHPLRTASDGLPDLAAGTIAAVYLGLGVVATNASRYTRNFSEIRGRSVYSEHEIDRIGGLESDDLALLLAVQATVRDDVLPALDTLASAHADAVAAWREVLDDHEDDLKAMLEIGDIDDVPPPRPDTPVPVTIEAKWDEGDLYKRNIGNKVYRYRESTGWTWGPLLAIAGFVLGVVATVTRDAPIMMAVLPVAGLAGGIVIGMFRKLLRCSGCGKFLTLADTRCKLCGGDIAGDVQTMREAREKIWAEDEARD